MSNVTISSCRLCMVLKYVKCGYSEGYIFGVCYIDMSNVTISSCSQKVMSLMCARHVKCDNFILQPEGYV